MSVKDDLKKLFDSVAGQIGGAAKIPLATRGPVPRDVPGPVMNLSPPVADKMGRPIPTHIPVVSTLRGFPVLPDTSHASQSVGLGRETPTI